MGDLTRDQNRVTALGAESTISREILPAKIDASTNRILVDATIASLPLPAGASTSAKQDSQIVLATALNSLVTALSAKTLTDDKVHILLQQIRDSISMRPDYVEATNTQAVSGTVSISGMSGTNTITTLSNQTNIGGFSADMLAENNSYQDWGLSIRSLLI